MKYGSLFSGAGGLDLAVEQWTGATCAWTCERDPHASFALAAHGTAPNLGDITAVDWTTVEPVDVICGGFPCQDISNAGKRAGITGARSGLWSFYADAVRHLRPRHVYVENVGALLVRGLGTVLGDLAEMGYNATWGCVRASDAGAPHRRERVFIVAADAECGGLGEGTGLRPHEPRGEWRRRPRHDDRTDALRQADVDHLAGCERPIRVADVASDGVGDEVAQVGGELFGVGVVGCGDGQGDLHGSDDDCRHREVKLLPTPSAGAFNDAEDPQSWLERAERLKEKHGNGNGAGMPLAVAVKLLPTPTSRDWKGRNQRNDETCLPGAVAASSKWGDYAPAIARWEHVLGRPAPAPVDGRGRLSAHFVEWMQGAPVGWVTDLDLKRTAQLRLLGNWVVPQQALLAFDTLEHLAVTS